MDPIRVIIASTQRLFRESLARALSREKDIQVIGEAGSDTAIVDQAHTLKPDIIIFETDTQDLTCNDIICRIRSKNKKIKIIVLARTATFNSVWQHIHSGVLGYLLQSSPLNDLPRAIRSVANKEIYLCPEVAGILVKTISASKSKDPVFSVLSSREREVLQLIAEGNKPGVIAEKLFISPKTVQVHQSNLKKKLNLKTTAELTKYAVSKGITPLEFIFRKRPGLD